MKDYMRTRIERELSDIHDLAMNSVAGPQADAITQLSDTLSRIYAQVCEVEKRVAGLEGQA